MRRSAADRVAEYVDSPRLDQRMKRGTGISARVHGTRGLYRVHGDLKNRDSGGCTCPSQYQPCKHVAALFATYKRKPRTFVDVDKKLRELEGSPARDLVKLIEKIVVEHPEAVGSMGAKAFSRKSRWTDAEFVDDEVADE